MSDAAAFSATLVDVKLIRTRQCVQFLFEEDITKVPPNIVELLGGLAALASGEIECGIVRLNHIGRTGEAPPRTTPGESTLQQRDKAEGTAAGTAHLPNQTPSRTSSQEAFLLCNAPRGRVYLEQRRRHAIPKDNHINNVDEAKHVLRSWLGVESLSELDRDPSAADRWEQVQADYKTWLTAAKYVPWPGEHM